MEICQCLQNGLILISCEQFSSLRLLLTKLLCKKNNSKITKPLLSPYIFVVFLRFLGFKINYNENQKNDLLNAQTKFNINSIRKNATIKIHRYESKTIYRAHISAYDSPAQPSLLSSFGATRL